LQFKLRNDQNVPYYETHMSSDAFERMPQAGPRGKRKEQTSKAPRPGVNSGFLPLIPQKPQPTSAVMQSEPCHNASADCGNLLEIYEIQGTSSSFNSSGKRELTKPMDKNSIPQTVRKKIFEKESGPPERYQWSQPRSAMPGLTMSKDREGQSQASRAELLEVGQMAKVDSRFGHKDSSDQNFDYMFKLLIIGNSSVGKTSFLFRYADDSFSNSFVSTVGIDFKVKTVYRNDKRVKLQIWFLYRVMMYSSITTEHHYCVLYVSSVLLRATQIKTYSWDNAQVILVGNKCDMDDERVVPADKGKQLADQLGFEYFEASAKENINVRQVFERLGGRHLCEDVRERGHRPCDGHWSQEHQADRQPSPAAPELCLLTSASQLPCPGHHLPGPEDNQAHCLFGNSLSSLKTKKNSHVMLRIEEIVALALV
ncbi:RAB3A protein, partial [Atractosteus spatula]|nr:RAB3A protein [Atractosteus spatula]